MGIFSYLRGALSGKIYKKNILISKNIDKLYKKASQLSNKSFIKRWVFACIVSIHSNLNEFFLGKRVKFLEEQLTYQKTSWVKRLFKR